MFLATPVTAMEKQTFLFAGERGQSRESAPSLPTA